jgi:hypothetical protein
MSNVKLANFSFELVVSPFSPSLSALEIHAHFDRIAVVKYRQFAGVLSICFGVSSSFV